MTTTLGAITPGEEPMKTAIEQVREALESLIERIGDAAYYMEETKEAPPLNMLDSWIAQAQGISTSLKSLEGPRLTVDEAKDVFHAWQTANHNGWSQDAINQDLTDRLTKSANP